MLRRLRIENLVLIREAELAFSPGLNAVTGETGAGKTIFAQAIGLLLGAKADASYVGAAADEAYVEAELDVPDGFFDEEDVAALGELRPEGEHGLVVARRVFADGRTRAYAWGRAIAREDVAVATDRLVAMSGQFQQRRLARPSFQLDLLDAFCGSEQLERRREATLAWRELAAARRRHDELLRDAGAAAARLAELEALVEDVDGLVAGEKGELRAQQERLRLVVELGEGAATALEAIAPEEGDGASTLAAAAERALAPLERIAPELSAAAGEMRELAIRLREVGSDLHRFLASLDTDPVLVEEVEGRLQRISDLERRFGAPLDELLERADAARVELDEAAAGRDPVAVAAEQLAATQERVEAIADELHAGRTKHATPFAEAVAEELRGLGLGEGELLVELREREPGPAGTDEATFLIRPNAGLPFAPVAETASGGELSRIALALAAVAGGETLVFDEIDAGIGGVTAHAVAATLQRLGERAQVLTITHLPQIASVADRHFRVEKVPGDPTHTRIEELDELLRREELERMLGGQEFIASVGRGQTRGV
ncbi:MAG TPA: AAA family ATPase [Gaiellaceae bacterium]|nr:AAA family ATPase [Gaiellaceae bacterium]